MLVKGREIDLGERDPLAVGEAVEHAAPRVDDHGVTVRGPFGLVATPLSRRQHVAKVLDGAGADENLPVAGPVRAVKAEGITRTSAPSKASRRKSSGKRRS